MFTMQELSFAQKYPFTSIAKSIVKESAPSLSSIPAEAKERAKAILASALSNTPYNPKAEGSKELLLNEIVAFPVAKIYASCLSSEETFRKFARLISRSSFESLEKEKDSVIFDVAAELKIRFAPAEKGFFASLPLFDFLKASFMQSEPYMKLVNQKLDSGNVYLNRNEFIRFLSGTIFEGIYSSFPIDLQNVPKSIKEDANKFRERKFSDMKAISFGKFSSINPEFFPPCYAELYSKLISSSNLTHIARFDIAVFLAALGMNKEKIKELFSNAPNYDEKKTLYHLDRIFSKGKFLPPSCIKLKEHGLCDGDCNVKNPVQYYGQRVKETRKARR